MTLPGIYKIQVVLITGKLQFKLQNDLQKHTHLSKALGQPKDSPLGAGLPGSSPQAPLGLPVSSGWSCVYMRFTNKASMSNVSTCFSALMLGNEALVFAVGARGSGISSP